MSVNDVEAAKLATADTLDCHASPEWVRIFQ
jgi:hypothetical protein